MKEWSNSKNIDFAAHVRSCSWEVTRGKSQIVGPEVGSQNWELVYCANCVHLSCVLTSTCESIVQRRVWRVEIGFEIWYCRYCISSRRSAAPYIISVTPMREDDTSRVDRNSLVNDCEEPIISIEWNWLLGPVEAIFMEAEMGGEREFLCDEATSGGSVKASFHGLRGLEHKINWMGGIAILMREKLQVYFLRVITVLFQKFFLASWNGFPSVFNIIFIYLHTQKTVLHVPGMPVCFMPARKLPYKKSSRTVDNSAIGMNPSLGVPPLTIICSPASLPLAPRLLTGFVTMFSGDATFP